MYIICIVQKTQSITKDRNMKALKSLDRRKQWEDIWCCIIILALYLQSLKLKFGYLINIFWRAQSCPISTVSFKCLPSYLMTTKFAELMVHVLTENYNMVVCALLTTMDYTAKTIEMTGEKTEEKQKSGL